MKDHYRCDPKYISKCEIEVERIIEVTISGLIYWVITHRAFKGDL